MTATVWPLLLAVVAAYLAGSIPTSIIVGKLFFRIDIREHGSGNAGGTNAFRVFGWKAGLGVVLFDVGKGVFAVLVVAAIARGATLPYDLVRLIAGSAAVSGHIWTVFARFRGGKGVGTAAGMLAALYPIPFVIVLFLFALAIMLTGIVSVGSLTAALSFPFVILLLSVTGLFQTSDILFYFSIPLALVIVFTHRSNIVRLLHGNENRFPRLMLLRGKKKRNRRPDG